MNIFEEALRHAMLAAFSMTSPSQIRNAFFDPKNEGWDLSPKCEGWNG